MTGSKCRELRSILELTCPQRLYHFLCQADQQQCPCPISCASDSAGLAGQSPIWASTANSLGVGFPRRCAAFHHCSGSRQDSTFSSASSRDRNQFSFRHSCRNLPLNASMKALSVGLPGRLKSRATPFR